MKKILRQANYIFDRESNLWSKPNYGGIAYSDGDETELRIASIISSVQDISVLSTELRQHCTDWVSTYHLSASRANILRPFDGALSGDVLEIGAGCGAITRYLGESGLNVLALEGSPRRAGIARSRTRDLDNVTVLAERFDQFNVNQQFDVVTLIGVLEYANLFTPDENPPLAMLKKVRSLLKPNGKLVIAIENQLGLKYFSGAPEDHLGKPIIGIEGRYRNNQPQTFGYKALGELLVEAGFIAAEFLVPLPDYKLPVSILTKQGLTHAGFDAAAFASQSALRDPQLPKYSNFSLELAWPVIFKNALALDVANSFLVLTSPDASHVVDPNVLAYHYSTGRIEDYCKETIFINNPKHGIDVKTRQLSLAKKVFKQTSESLLKFYPAENDSYIFGTPLTIEFLNIVTEDNWTFDSVGQFLMRYLTIVKTFAGVKNTSNNEILLSGDFFDLVPQNIIIASDGRPTFIDREWQLNTYIELSHLLFRAVLTLINAVSKFGLPAAGPLLTRYQFFSQTFAKVNFELTEDSYNHYISVEATLQESVSGCNVDAELYWGKDGLLQTLNIYQALQCRDEELAAINASVVVSSAMLNEKSAMLDEKTAMLDEKTAMLNEKSALLISTITSLNKVQEILHDKEARIQLIYSSLSWRITRPLRALKSFLGL